MKNSILLETSFIQSAIDYIKDDEFDKLNALLLSKVPGLVAAVVIIIAGIFISKLIGKLVVKAMSAKGIDSSIHSFIKSVVMFTINVIFILSALSTLNIDVNSFITAIGAAGITAGLGLQQSISQFASGIQILVNRPFKSGDFIDIGGTVSGSVQEIKLMYTVLKTVDNRRVIIPNATITNSSIINYDAENLRRIDLSYSISYNADTSKAKSVILDVVNSCEYILKSPEPKVAVNKHTETALNLSCLVWVNKDEYWDAYYYMQENVKLAFDRNDILIPYNDFDIRVVK